MQEAVVAEIKYDRSYHRTEPDGMSCGRVVDVSVILTLYNQKSALDLVSNRLLHQDYQGSVEIIACDDGSDQDSLDALRAVAASTSVPVRYIWQPREGERRAACRDNGLRCAWGASWFYWTAT
jgi:hypothetical protein